MCAICAEYYAQWNDSKHVALWEMKQCSSEELDTSAASWLNRSADPRRKCLLSHTAHTLRSSLTLSLDLQERSRRFREEQYNAHQLLVDQECRLTCKTASVYCFIHHLLSATQANWVF